MGEDTEPQHDQNAAWSIMSYLLSGILVWGGAGWLIDRWMGYEALFLPIGVVLGCALGFYLAYVRYIKPR